MLVKVVRPLWLGGQRREVGAVLDLPDGRAIEIIATGRVERTEPTPTPGPMTTKSGAGEEGSKEPTKPSAPKKGASKDVG